MKIFKRDTQSQQTIRKSRQARRHVQRESFKLSINRKVVIFSGLVGFLTLLIMLLPKQDWLPIEKIRISGSFKHLDTQLLRTQLETYLGQGFFEIDIQNAQQQINRQSWIKTASVRRVWPNLLMVKVKEKQAYARWDENHLIDTDGNVFKADTQVFNQLPLIHGYQANSKQLLQRYKEMKERFDHQNIHLSAMQVDNKGALTLWLNNQLRVSLGSDNNDQKIHHMLAVYNQQIKSRSQHIQHIDFRYSNGFAIAWKAEYLKQSGQLQRGNKNV